MTAERFFMSAWDWKPSVIAGCVVLLAGYAWMARFRMGARALAWLAGVTLLFLMLVSPVDALADGYLFSVHMAKHIVFVLVIPALLLLGIPAPLRSLTFAAPGTRELPPALAWMAGIGVMAFWHIPAVFDTALAHEPLHIVEHLSLLAGGVIYWWPILSPIPSARLHPVPQATAYLFTSCLACTSIGIVITFAPSILYAAYAHPADPYGILPLVRGQWGISPALDQQIGGVLMWVPCCLVYLTAILAMFARWYAIPEAAEA
jgi:cytochrome c oxidase assembly factor CtaG